MALQPPDTSPPSKSLSGQYKKLPSNPSKITQPVIIQVKLSTLHLSRMILECEQEVLTDHFPCLLGKGKTKFNTLTKSGGKSRGCKDMGELKVNESEMVSQIWSTAMDPNFH
jgi:hypothetical protein